jgi:hypothetical protein
MTHLLTTIGPCLLLTMVVVTTSTTEGNNFKAPTAAQGANLNAIRPYPSPSVSPRSQEAEPFNGGVGLHAGHTGASPPRAHSARGNRIHLQLVSRSALLRLPLHLSHCPYYFSVLASYSRLSYAANGSPASSSSTSTYLEVYRKQQRRLKEIKSNET